MIVKLFGLNILEKFAHIAPACRNDNFFGFPSWNKYLHTHPGNRCAPQLESINDIWLVALAIVEIGLRVAVLVAIFFAMFAGLKYVNSRGNAEKTEAAKKTLFDALIGLVIAVSATAVVSFIGGRFSAS